MPSRPTKVAALLGPRHLDAVASRSALARKHHDYAREANWAHALARELEDDGREVLLEVPYWSKYAKMSGWPRCDIWCPAARARPDLWIETKIVERSRDGDVRLGSKPASEIIETWASDVWRLLVGPHTRDPERTAHAALVVYAFGSSEPLARGSSEQRRLSGHDVDAQATYVSLDEAGHRSDPVRWFIKSAEKQFCVTVTEPRAAGGGEKVQAIVIEWILTGAPRTAPGDVRA